MPTSRRCARRLRDERGFTLMEMLVATMLFAIVTTPLVGVLTSSVAAQRLARERTIAEQTAQAQIETIRGLAYDSVGTVGGNPPGSVVATRTVDQPGLHASMQTRVSYVSDPTRTSYVTSADYKKVVVSIVRTRDAKQLTQEVTYVAPPSRGAYNGVNGTIVKAQIVDLALSQPVQGALVSLATGPSAPRSDTTDASGTVQFAGLAANPTSGPQAYYDITTALTGYQTLKDDVPPSGAAHVQLAPGQSFTTVLRVYRPATIYVVLNAAAGGLYAGAATVSVGSSRAAQTFAVTGGRLTVTSLGGEPLVPGLSYTIGAQAAGGVYAPAVAKAVPNAYPTDLTSTYTLTTAGPYATQPLTVKVTTATGTVIPGARVDVTAGPLPAYLTGTTDASGNATFTVPSGTGYTAVATATGQGTGTWSGSVLAPVTTTVKVS